MIKHRDPAQVMRLTRMGANHQNRLSFMRILLRYLKLENWQFSRVHWQINERNVGYAVYQAKGPRRTYSLIAFAHDLPDEKRSDRVISTAWDATFTLFDGVPTKDDILRLIGNVPYQEAGRILQSELSLSRANRSSRLWEYVVDCLATGQQPDIKEIEKVGYLMRTTAVYGAGKFGAADRASVETRTALSVPFLVEMLNVYLTRAFTLDLVEHAAKMQGQEQAVPLERNIRRKFGIGNSTGLGMAPFLINHPALLHAWVFAREEAFRRVRQLTVASQREKECFIELLQRAQLAVSQWQSQHSFQAQRITELTADLEKLSGYINDKGFSEIEPWETLYQWSTTALSVEGQEMLLSLMIEPYPSLVDDLAKVLCTNENNVFNIDGSMSVGATKSIIEKSYGWVLKIDFSDSAARKYVWYTSIEKQEPRLGERYEDKEIANYEQPLCIAYDIYQLYQTLLDYPENTEIAEVLTNHPQYRHIVRRTQIVARMPYAEICDNLTAEDVFPINLLRFKLAFFGATNFDPRSNLWVRICMYQNAPFPDEIAHFPCDDWVYPQLSGENS